MNANDILSSLGFSVSRSWDATSGTMIRNGREYRVVVTGARADLWVCNSAPGMDDGRELARAYGSASTTVPAMLARIPDAA